MRFTTTSSSRDRERVGTTMRRSPGRSVDPFRPELYDAIAPGYYDRVYRRGRGVQWFWHHHRFAAVAQRLPRPLDRLIDLGCGPGTFLGNFHELYRRGVGMDIAAPQIEYARVVYDRPQLEFRVGDVTTVDPGPGFDAAVSIEVIEHLRSEDTHGFLASIYRVLAPGGTLVLTTPNYRSHWPVLEWLVSRLGPVDYREQHLNRFDSRRLRDEVEAAGFAVARVETFFVLAPFGAAVSRPLAEGALRWERRFLDRLGAELVLTAHKPADATPARPTNSDSSSG